MSLENKGKNGKHKGTETPASNPVAPASNAPESAANDGTPAKVTLTAEEKNEAEVSLADVESKLTLLRKPGRKTAEVQAETDTLRTMRTKLRAILGMPTETETEKSTPREKTPEEIHAECNAFATSKGAMHVSTSLNVETVTAVFHRILYLTGIMIEESSKREREKIAESILGRFVILRDSGVSLMRYAVTIPGHVRAAYSGNNPADALTVFEKIDALNIHSREFGLPDSPDPVCVDTVTGETLTRDMLKALTTPVVPATK